MPTPPPNTDPPAVESSPGESRRIAILAAALAIGSGLLALPLIVSSLQPGGFRSDVSIYFDYAGRIWAGSVPYRDFSVEYPPGALLAFLAPRLLGLASERAYTVGFSVLAIAAAVWLFVLAARTQGRTLPDADDRSRGRWITAVALLLLTAVLPFRFDVFPALLTLFALRSQFRGRYAAAGALLAIATCVKLYPIVLLPLFTIDLIGRRDRRGLTRFILASVVAAVAIVGPAFAVAPRWLATFLGYHLQRGVQIESLGSSLILLAAKLGTGGPADVAWSFGAHHVAAPGIATIARSLPLLMVAAVVAVYAVSYRLSRRSSQSPRMLAVATFGALLAFVLFNKVLSPQYLIWLVPFAGWLDRRAAFAFAAACVLTVAIFPFTYQSLVAQQTPAVLILAGRNLSLLLSFAFALTALSRNSIE